MAARQHTLRGTRTLIRLALRRDRIRIPVWILGVVGFTVSFVPSLPELYPDAEARQGRAALMENPATLAMTGPGFGRDDYTFGAMVAQEFLGYTAILVAIMSLLLVVRHTRTEEETGRAELARAGVVGRHAALAAALTVVVAVNLVIAGLLAVLMPAALEELSLSSSVLYGLSHAGVGVAFAAIGALAAQVSYGARGAIGLGMALLGYAYGMRAIGDSSVEALSWLSPIGWAQQTRSYVDDLWWPLAIPVAVSVVLIGGAVALSRRRDVGAGLMAPRRGPADAGVGLSGPFGLAWRLQRGTLIAWASGLVLFGIMYGSIIPEIEAFVDDNAFIAEAMAAQGDDPVDGFIGVVIMLLAITAGGYVLQSALRMRAEEAATRAEVVLTGAVARWHYMAGHLVQSVVAGPVLLLVSAGAMAATGAAASGSWEGQSAVFGAALAYVPALWLLAAGAAALYGLLPKLVNLMWIVLGYGVVAGMLGVVLDLPEWTMNLSPFNHVPQWPSDDITAAPLLVMTAVSIGMIVVGVFGFRRRNIA